MYTESRMTPFFFVYMCHTVYRYSTLPSFPTFYPHPSHPTRPYEKFFSTRPFHSSQNFLHFSVRYIRTPPSFNVLSSPLSGTFPGLLPDTNHTGFLSSRTVPSLGPS